MLPKEARLRSGLDFSATYKQGKSLILNHLRIFYRKLNQNNSRFGFVVSKKHAPRIVDRNRVKRWLRQAVKENWAGIIPGFDAILQARPGINTRDGKKLRLTLGELLRRAKILEK